MLKDLKDQLDKQFKKSLNVKKNPSDSRVKRRESLSESNGTSNKRTQKQQAKQQEHKDPTESQIRRKTETDRKGGDRHNSEDTEDYNKRVALKQFVKESKVLRFKDRMANVRLWKNNSIAYAQRHRMMIENPTLETEPNYTSPVQVTELCQQQESIEKEFKELEKRLNDYRKIEREKGRENAISCDQYKYEQSRKDGKVSNQDERNQKHIEFD